MSKVFDHLEDVISVKECDSSKVELLFVDFKYDDSMEDSSDPKSSYPEVIGPDVFSKRVSIDNREVGKIESLLFEKMCELGQKHMSDRNIENFKNVKVDCTRKFIAKILNASNLIATTGRVGPGHFVYVPKSYKDKIEDVLIDGMLGGLKVIYTDKLEKSVLVGRKNRQDQPGLLLLYFGNERATKAKKILGEEDIYSMRFEIVDVGFAPERQYAKFDIEFV